MIVMYVAYGIFAAVVAIAATSALASAGGEPRSPSARLTGAMTIEDGAAIVVIYVLVSAGVAITFLLAAFVIGWFIGRLRERRRGRRGEE